MAPRTYPRRLGLACADWPAADRAAWQALFAPGDVFTDAGPCRRWRPATRKNREHHYALWLGWLASQGALDPDASPGARAAPEAVLAFAAALRARVAPLTTTECVVGLKSALKAMHPETDWRWLERLCKRLKAWVKPSVDRSAALRPIEEIHAASTRALDRLMAGPLSDRGDAVACRDMLIVLLLSAAPVRLGNLAAIEIGRHLVRSGERTMLRFGEGETKNGMRLSFELPRHVEPYLAFYLERVRPSFSPAPDCRRLWIGITGRPLGAKPIYERVVLATGRLFGTPINPHAFRACAATSFALRSPALARQAAPLLGHRDFATTEKYYVKAGRLEASRRVNAALKELRGASGGRRKVVERLESG